MQRPAALLLVLLLTVSLPFAATGVFAGSPPDADGIPSQASHPSRAAQVSQISGTDRTAQTAQTAQTSQTSFDRNRVVLAIHENGSTTWTFQYRRTLSNESERRNFEAFSDEFNSNETSLYRGFESNAETLITEGQNVTGREMDATNFSRRAYVSNTTFGRPVGVVEMSFVWTNFGTVRDDRLVVGDVFEGGLYLSPRQTLVVSPDPGLEFDSVDPPGTPSNPSSLRESDSVTWQGEKEFTDNRPRIVLVPSESRTTTGGGGGSGPGVGSTTGEGSLPPSNGGLPVVPLGVGAVLIAAVAAAAWWYNDEAGGEGEGAGIAGGGDHPDAGSGSAASAPDAARGPSGEGAQAPPVVTDDELLSDEDRVVSLLRERGGRMKQVDIVDRTGWSKSKVSMLLSEMEEEGLISKLRVGRENVISLQGHEPDAAGSPFDGGE